MSNTTETRTNEWPRSHEVDSPTKALAVPCTRCGGTGVFHTYGTCFRCGGWRTDPTLRDWIFPFSWSDEQCQEWDDKRLARNARAAETRRARKDNERKDKRAEFMDELDPEVAARIAEINELDVDDRHYIASDILWKLSQYGSISQGQIDLLLKVQEEFEAEAAEKANAPELPELIEGRRELTGVVISTKTKESQFGTQFKMLVELDDGNRVYGTIPRSIDDQVWDTSHTQRVTFTAEVTVSGDDEHFGWYRRPTKATAEQINDGEETT